MRPLLMGLRHFLWSKKSQSYTHQSFNLDLGFFLIYLSWDDFLGFEVYPYLRLLGLTQDDQKTNRRGRREHKGNFAALTRSQIFAKSKKHCSARSTITTSWRLSHEE